MPSATPIDPKLISPIVFGAGALNNVQYGGDNNMDAVGALKTAFANGINAIDTSAYYGRSEIIVGDALQKLAVDRSSLFIISKAGRWETNEFDYSEASIRRSVARSLDRLHTEYLDLLLVHDVEFMPLQQGLQALAAAAKLRDEGVCRYIGFSGLPLPFMLELARLTAAQGIKVDAVLSYCNLTIQNTQLKQFIPEFKATNIEIILNASPLGMSLLRSGATHEWHPASAELKRKTQEIAAHLASEDRELADVACQYAFSQWSHTVVGMRNAQEVQAALDNFTKSGVADHKTFNTVQSMYGHLMDTVWSS